MEVTIKIFEPLIGFNKLKALITIDKTKNIHNHKLITESYIEINKTDYDKIIKRFDNCILFIRVNNKRIHIINNELKVIWQGDIEMDDLPKTLLVD